MEQLIEALRAEADECFKSSVGNGEYNAIFHVASIVLSSLATRLDGVPPPPHLQERRDE